MHTPVTLVTGTTTGIGYYTALALAQQGHQLITLNRNAQKSRLAAEHIRAATGQPVQEVLADLGNFDSVRQAADEVLSTNNSLDVIVHNAGTWFSKQTLNPQGFEMQLAVNHLSPFLLTHLLLPALLPSPDGRIVNVASDTHFRGRIELDNMNLDRGYHGIKSYARSKLAMVQCTYILAALLSDTNISVNALQPGLVKTDIGHKHTIGLHSIAWWIRKLGGVSPEKGAETSVFLASSVAAQHETGKYWDKCKAKPSSRLSYDSVLQQAVWDWSQEATGIHQYLP